MSGKSLTSISIPIDVFQTKSYLERFAYALTFAPYYINKIRSEPNISKIDKLKYITALVFSISIMYLSLEKPFNPILGETFQGIINGDLIFCE